MSQINYPVDIVYTWVDDTQPGYRQMIHNYGSTTDDLNPNRTRDNLDLLKYSLRSLEKFVPWVRNIYIFTSRPQVPIWLKTGSKVIIIHHDEIIDKDNLPTFNSFCIVSYIADIKYISDNFLYIEDDMLFGNTVSPNTFISSENKIILYPRIEITTPGFKKDNNKMPPWNKAVSFCNFLLDQKYSYKRRRSINRIPLMIEKSTWNMMIDNWREAFTYTRKSKFRSQCNIAPEYLYPYYLYYENKAVMANIVETYKKSFYLGLDNNFLITPAGLKLINLLRPEMYCLNDNFGADPYSSIVEYIRTFLENYYPEKSSFEI